MTAFALDVVLVILLVSYGYTGYRHGFVVSVMSLIGFLCGGALGMWLLPELLRRWHTVDENVLWRTTALVFGVFVFASLGQALAVGVGARLRSGLRIERARAIDSISLQPSARKHARLPMNASPAPVVSTGCTGNPGTWVMPAC